MKTTVKLYCYEDGGSVDASIQGKTIDDLKAIAKKKLEQWLREGEWGDEGAEVRGNWKITVDGEEITEDVDVVIEPNHDSLIRDSLSQHELESICGTDPDDHDWTSEGDGGLKENPGVWSTGGTSIIFHSHCRKCGLHRVLNTTGSQKNPGEHDTVTYRMLSEEEITGHRLNGTMDKEEE